jgi:hypothetical protein
VLTVQMYFSNTILFRLLSILSNPYYYVRYYLSEKDETVRNDKVIARMRFEKT